MIYFYICISSLAIFFVINYIRKFKVYSRYRTLTKIINCKYTDEDIKYIAKKELDRLKQRNLYKVLIKKKWINE